MRANEFEKQLSKGQMQELVSFATDPGRTIDECADWLKARGFQASRSSVARWKKNLPEKLPIPADPKLVIEGITIIVRGLARILPNVDRKYAGSRLEEDLNAFLLKMPSR
jgi:hypothetical protein